MTKTASGLRREKYEAQIQTVSKDESPLRKTDVLAIEEPLEIRLGEGIEHRAVSITMRTPGDDFALAAGFLFTEGILFSSNQIKSIKHCGKFPNLQNTVRVDLAANTEIDLEKIKRNFYTTSSCGVCGKSSLDALTVAGAKKIEWNEKIKISPDIIHQLPEKLIENQTVFGETGGLHAAALFDFSGNLIEIKEDVGRHNAVDKLIGDRFLKDELPLSETVLFLSGRASFELIQKSVMAQIPLIAAVGAPSSLAVQAAKEFNTTLIGFVRDRRFNIYSAGERIEID